MYIYIYTYVCIYIYIYIYNTFPFDVFRFMRAAAVGMATALLSRWSTNRISYLLNQDQQDALFFRNLFQ